jgi:hypothetical protein
MDGTSVVGQVLGEFLEALVDGLISAGAEPPARRYVAQSQPSVDWAEAQPDDGLLAVWCDRIEARALGERRPSSSGDAQMQGWHSVALLRAQLWRPYPNLNEAGSAPDSDEITEATQALTRQAWGMWVELGERRDAERLFRTYEGKTLVSRQDVGIGSLTPLAPSGYAAGVQLNVEVSLPARLEP